MTSMCVCLPACLPACTHLKLLIQNKTSTHTERERDSQQFRHATELENKNKTSCMWYKCELSWALRQQTADQKQNKNNSNVKRHSELASGWDHKSRDNDVIHTGEIRADDGLRLSWSSKIDRVREAVWPQELVSSVASLAIVQTEPQFIRPFALVLSLFSAQRCHKKQNKIYSTIILMFGGLKSAQ